MEGFPNSLVEGMIFSPVIAVDCMTGPREILCNQSKGAVCNSIEYADYGVLVKPMSEECSYEQITKDDAILAEAIVELLHDEKKYEKYKKSAKERVMDFSYEVYQKQIINAMED